MKPNETSFLKSFFSRWLGMYVVVYIFPFPAKYLPFMYEWVAVHVINWRNAGNFWVGKNLLGLESLEYSGGMGSGDTTFDYVLLITLLLVALILAIVGWGLRKYLGDGSKLYTVALIYARYFVGITLIHYGVAKFMIGQFPGPSISGMEQPFGDFSPMGLAWRFFGYSDLYKAFMGISEILAGFLLLFRRTLVVGVLLSIAVVTNIVLVNFSFDVPVKLFSSHLLFFSILIFWPYAKKVFDLLLLQRPGQLVVRPLVFSSNRKKWTHRLVKLYMVGFIPLATAFGHVSSQSFRNFHNPWEGTYEVLTFEKNQSEFPADAEWTKVMLDAKSMVTERVSGRKSYFTIKEIGEGGIITFLDSDNSESEHTLKVVDNGDSCQLVATVGVHQFDIKARRKKKSDYFLISRGFNWVNEYPLNR